MAEPAVQEAGADADQRDAAAVGARDAGVVTEPLPWPRLPPVDAGAAEYDVEIGIADPATGTDLAPLAPGGPIPIGGRGQSGLIASLAIRLTHPARELAREAAIINLLLTTVPTAVTSEARGWGEAVRLYCEDGAGCVRAPIEVEITHLAKLPELEGLRVQVDVSVRDAADPTLLLARARAAGVLERIATD